MSMTPEEIQEDCQAELSEAIAEVTKPKSLVKVFVTQCDEDKDEDELIAVELSFSIGEKGLEVDINMPEPEVLNAEASAEFNVIARGIIDNFVSSK